MANHKPFRVTESGGGIDVGKLPDSRFVDTKNANPVKIFRQAKDEGRIVTHVLSERRLPDGEREIPWPEAEAGPTPMKLTK